jgi:hypothetical protein
MSRPASPQLAFGLVLASIAWACGEPPDKEMQEAQIVLDAATAADADQYAPAEMTAARDALKRAEEAVAARDYRQALNHALDGRARAEAAAQTASAQKAEARAGAERAIAAASAALAAAQAALDHPRIRRLSARALVKPRGAVSEASRHLQEARSALAGEDYSTAVRLAGQASTGLEGAVRDLDAASASSTRRPR